MDEIGNDQAQNPIKISKVGKRTNPSISLVMKIIIIFLLKDENLLMFHWAQKNSS
jgi:hypothetical protein